MAGVSNLDAWPNSHRGRHQTALGLHSLPVRWSTEIRRWEPPYRFIDVRSSGPYRHRLRFGMIGRAVHALKVRRDVKQIFDYRFRRIGELFAAAVEEPR